MQDVRFKPSDVNVRTREALFKPLDQFEDIPWQTYNMREHAIFGPELIAFEEKWVLLVFFVCNCSLLIFITHARQEFNVIWPNHFVLSGPIMHFARDPVWRICGKSLCFPRGWTPSPIWYDIWFVLINIDAKWCQLIFVAGERVFGELHTADWWLNTEQELPTGQGAVMLAPLKIFLDEVALTSFSNAKVFPLLMECANIIEGQNAISAFIPVLRSESMVSDLHYHLFDCFSWTSILSHTYYAPCRKFQRVPSCRSFVET